ncbi:MAG: thymidylate synthase [Lachnospiraceae bacterium]|jgi:thymidylate synthase|nr:thymidylate synthase [Lachnospiraceae bacterium]
MKIDTKYANIVKSILNTGYEYEDPNRKGVIRREIPMVVLEHNVEEGFPIITIRKSWFKGAVSELLLFLKGSTDIRDFWDYNIRFWDKDFMRFQMTKEGWSKSEIEFRIKEKIDDAYKLYLKDKGDSRIFMMGRIYSAQYAKQYDIFDKFKENPLRTDLIINSWQLNDLNDMALVPCHYDIQLVGSNDGFEIVWIQRSTDIILGTPVNVQFYYLMGLILQEWSGHTFKGIRGILKKVHIYNNGIDLAKQIIDIPESEYKDNIKVDFKMDSELKGMKFSEMIQKLEPNQFSISNYKYVIKDTIDMLTYNI